MKIRLIYKIQRIILRFLGLLSLMALPLTFAQLDIPADPPSAVETKTSAEENAQAPAQEEDPDNNSGSEGSSSMPLPVGNMVQIPIEFREKPVFYLYSPAKLEPLARKRASELSRNLKLALDISTPMSGPPLELKASFDGAIEIKVRGTVVGRLEPNDTTYAGYSSTASYIEFLRTGLSGLVDSERRRQSIQQWSLHFFMTVFFLLLGLLAFRQVSKFFDRADKLLDEKKDSLSPISFLSETVISEQTLGGVLAIALLMGRILSSVLILSATLLLILGQFESSRTWMTQVITNLGDHVILGFQSFLFFFPKILLGALLVFVGHIGLKALALYLNGIESGRIHWKLISPHRSPIVRFWGGILIVGLITPLFLATLMGGFGSPIETWLTRLAIILVALGLGPYFLSLTYGSILLWQDHLPIGTQCKFAKSVGVIRRRTLDALYVEDLNGQVTRIPFILLAFVPVTKLPNANKSMRIEMIGDAKTELELFFKKIREVLDINFENLEIAEITQSQDGGQIRFLITANGSQEVVLAKLWADSWLRPRLLKLTVKEASLCL